MTRLGRRLALAAAFGFAAWSAAEPASAASRDDIRRLIVTEADATAVPASMALAVAKVESDFRDDYEGPTGGRGVMQILPRTARAFGVRPDDLWDARRNVRLGLKLLTTLVDETDGDWEIAIGRFGADRIGDSSERDDAVARDYVRSVMTWERQYAEELAANNQVERRKRAVLYGPDDRPFDVAGDGRYVDKALDAEPVYPRRSIRRESGWRAIETADLASDIESRRQQARRSLDDFGPDPVVRSRVRWR